jgi:hypothetical protein
MQRQQSHHFAILAIIDQITGSEHRHGIRGFEIALRLSQADGHANR